MKLSLISFSILFVSTLAAADTLMPFTTDGCTHFPNGTPESPSLWLGCCVEHDMKYWVGGSREDRLLADRGLRACVSQTGHPEIGEAMFEGVRAGGSPYLATTWRWGYGWLEMRGYQELSESERQTAEQLRPHQPQ